MPQPCSTTMARPRSHGATNPPCLLASRKPTWTPIDTCPRRQCSITAEQSKSAADSTGSVAGSHLPRVLHQTLLYTYNNGTTSLSLSLSLSCTLSCHLPIKSNCPNLLLHTNKHERELATSATTSLSGHHNRPLRQEEGVYRSTCSADPCLYIYISLSRSINTMTRREAQEMLASCCFTFEKKKRATQAQQH
jgi:hypothetical protein